MCVNKVNQKCSFRGSLLHAFSLLHNFIITAYVFNNYLILIRFVKFCCMLVVLARTVHSHRIKSKYYINFVFSQHIFNQQYNILLLWYYALKLFLIK